MKKKKEYIDGQYLRINKLLGRLKKKLQFEFRTIKVKLEC